MTNQPDTFSKPREKLKAHGPAALEDHELLAIVLSRGTVRENVFSLSQRLLKGFDREELLNEKNLSKLRQSLKLGFVQTCQLMAALELGRRFFGVSKNNKKIQSIGDAYELVRNMQFLQKEYVRGLYLNSRHRVIHDEIITIGSLDSNILHPREVFRPAIEYGATAIILAHNHPSGDCRPSKSDLEVTKKIRKIGLLMQIPVLDHLVIGENAYTSLQKAGVLP